MHVENNDKKQGDRASCPFSTAFGFSGQYCIYICIAGMNSVFDKGHEARYLRKQVQEKSRQHRII